MTRRENLSLGIVVVLSCNALFLLLAAASPHDPQTKPTCKVEHRANVIVHAPEHEEIIYTVRTIGNAVVDAQIVPAGGAGITYLDTQRKRSYRVDARDVVVYFIPVECQTVEIIIRGKAN